ncbi:cell wall-active antibiotics response protein LiaF [Saccharibacillus sp. CPCC 101409]|uniref:cell wall-active antibiotics response protein LiaF n=1 Tax=Saccharibacillus sp. CPCC 101409 TaxID=3058041 RepID=UPI002673018F|nr:cell wall-active antibiotics response protein LiaF [Saccharibacillus sp. CPCC 101409]MDO3410963.1 cell wall-active antibiotics response protein LiaF [Saccharibacillus sp. CPCC 101409]
MRTRKRTWAIVLIAVGTLMLLGKWVSMLSLAALLVLLYGVYTMRAGRTSSGYKWLAAGAGLMLLDHIVLLLGGILVSIGVFYARARELHAGRDYIRRQELVSQLHRERDPWVPENISLWNLLGDVGCDFALALPAEPLTVIHMQGLIGDADLIFPEEYGIEFDIFVGYGKVGFEGHAHSGLLNKFIWRSPGYERSEQKIRVVMAYATGDINIRMS